MTPKNLQILQSPTPKGACWAILCLLTLGLGCHSAAPPDTTRKAPVDPRGPNEGPVSENLEATDPAGTEASTGDGNIYRLVGGWWWDGTSFERKSFYVVDGRLTESRPDRVDKVLEFGDRFIVPPFAEAHNHNLESAYGFERVHSRYLEQGIFYVKVANNIGELTHEIRDRLADPKKVDVSFANGGITSSGGHPSGLYEKVILPRAFPHHGVDWLRGRAFYEVDSLEDLDDIWPRLVQGRPDFVKTFLLYAEEYAERRDDPKYQGVRGLDPELLPVIVERARKSGLRVAAHVETASDFRFAIRSGVQEIMHLPGYRIPESRRFDEFRLSEQDAREAAAAGALVATTTVLANQSLRDLDRWRKVREMQAHNLSVLHRNGVPLAVGSDRYDLTSLDEIMNLRALEIFDETTLLNLWCGTGALIFPKRKLGRLEEGYEASFLALDENPLVDFTAVRRISFRFKEGHVVTP